MALSVPAQAEQQNVVANPSIGTVFFQSQQLAYNYKTDQWTRLPSTEGKKYFQRFGEDRVLGLIASPGSGVTAPTKMVQDSSLTGASNATVNLVSGERELSPDAQVYVRGVRPLQKGTSTGPRVLVGHRDQIHDSVTTITGSNANSITGFHGYYNRNSPNGQLIRVGLYYPTGNFSSVSAAYVDFERVGVS